ncbi:MAG: peroxiredoxin [Candidatus Poseidoniia archaeon]|nr:peroxiredoxin [Candidatus Poseidoniia archaeon]MDP7006665.1 peroxiredoxin [Candidatus Poseidoniia archaeon]
MSEIPQANDSAPPFEAVDQEGITVSLADFAGRWLALYFYPRDDTPGCTVEAQEFTALGAEFAALECVARSTFLIAPDGTVARAWPNVRAKGHAAKVLAELEAQRG